MIIRVEISADSNAYFRYREYVCEDYSIVGRVLFIVCGYLEGNNPNELRDFATVLADGDVVTTKVYPPGTSIPRRDDT